MAGGRNWLRRTAMLLALCAGSVAASAPELRDSGWTADPDEQFLLDVNIHQLRLGDGVRAYNTPEGTCVVLGDFLTTLDVPMHIDISAKKASGWAFKESNRIAIDYRAMAVSYAGKAETIAPGAIRETPEGWCVQTSALTRWFGIGVKPVTTGSVLVLESTVKLPVEMAKERQQRAARIHPASFDLKSLPQVKVPYRMWRAPALDFVVSGGVTYRAKDGVRVDRRTWVYAAGEIADLSYDAQAGTNQKGKPNLLRLRAYRSDPDGTMLGPLKATHFGFGDVEGYSTRLTGTGAAGRGAVVTNRPLTAQTAFDRTRFEGDLPVGWEAEIYRNNELLGFAKSDGSQRYIFDNVQLVYGENHVEVRLYGPQGQVRTRAEDINVGRNNVPPGKTWYWAGFNQPGRDIVTLAKPFDLINQSTAQATVSLEHGLDERTSVGFLAREMLFADKHLTFLEGSVRRSIGPAMIELGAARESDGGTAARAQFLAKFKGVSVSAEALLASDFRLQGGKAQSIRDLRVSTDAPLKLGRAVIPAHADVRWVDRRDGTSRLDAAARLSANINRFNLAGDVRYQRDYLVSGPAPPANLSLGLIGSGHVRDVRLRGEAVYDVAPKGRLRTAQVSAYWSASQNANWEGALAYEASNHRARARISHIRRLNSMAIALIGEAASDGSVAVGFNLNFSLDARNGITLSRRPLAQAGIVHALVYRDLNDNGVRDREEPVEKGALITTGGRPSDQATDSPNQLGVTPIKL
ncbi:MAG: hypothetical protein V4502_09165, partial [Pseudomonadota bacterium]